MSANARKRGKATLLAEENKQLEEDVAALEDALAVASAGSSKTTGFKVSAAQATGNPRSSILASQIWEHGKKGKLHGYEEKSDLQDGDVKKGKKAGENRSPTPKSSDKNPGARPKSGKASRPSSAASNSRASSAVNARARKEADGKVQAEESLVNVAKKGKGDLTEEASGVSGPLKAKNTPGKTDSSDATNTGSKESSSASLKVRGNSAKSRNTETLSKERQQSPGAVSQTKGTSTKACSTDRSSPNPAKAKTDDLTILSSKANKLSVAAKGARSAKNKKVPGSTNLFEAGASSKCELANSKAEDTKVSGPTTSTGRQGSASKDKASDAPIRSTNQKDVADVNSVKKTDHAGAQRGKSEKKVSSGPGSEDNISGSKSDRADVVSAREGKENVRSGVKVSPTAVRNRSGPAGGNRANTSDKALESSTPKTDVKPSSASSGHRAVPESKASAATTNVKSVAEKAAPKQAARETAKDLSKKGQQPTAVATSRKLSKEKDQKETKPTVAVVREKDEDTKQAEREAARILAEERQRRLHLARSPTTLISLEKDDKTNEVPSKRVSSAKKNRKSHQTQVVKDTDNEDCEGLFDLNFDSKSFEERTAEMKAHILEKLIRKTNQDNKEGDFRVPNKADKDNFNKSMTSGATRISPEGRGDDLVTDDGGSYKSMALGRIVTSDPSVVAWLRQLNLKNTDKYIRLFAEHEIDMEGLMYISEDQLKEIGIRAIGAYNKILMAIQELQKHRDQPQKKQHHVEYDDDDFEDYDDNDDVSAEAVPVQGTRSSVLRQNVIEARRKPPEIPQPWLNPNRNKSVRSKIDTGLAISPSKPERMLRRDGRGDSAPSTYSLMRAGFKEDSKGRVVKASSLSRLHDEEQRQQHSWKMEQASSMNQLANVVGDARDPCQPKQIDGSVSFLPRPVYQKQRSLDWVSKHSDSSSSGEEFTLSSRRQRELLAQKEHYAESDPMIGMKIEIRRKSDITVEEPHVPGQVTLNPHGRHRDILDDMERVKKPPKNIPRQSVALPVVQFGVGVGSSKAEENQIGAKEKGVPKTSKSDHVDKRAAQESHKVDQKDTDPWSRRSEWSEEMSKKERQTSRPRTQNLLNSIQGQLDTLQSSALEDNGTKHLIQRLQAQLVDIQQQVLHTHHQQQQIKASPRNVPPQLPDSLTPKGSHLLQENIRPRRQMQSVTSQRLRVMDNLNVSARSDSSSDTSSTGTSPRSNQDKKLSPILRPELSDLEPGSNGRLRPTTSLHQGPPAKTQHEMLRDIRKQKDGYRRKIKNILSVCREIKLKCKPRHLEAELTRLKYKDPVRQMEVNQDEVMFDEKGLIGEGAFSQVFRGNFHGSEVAIKRLKIKLSAQEKNYFTAEVSLMQDLRHPRVVLLLGVCTTSPLPLMILEFMPKGSLYYFLHDPDTAPLDHVAYYVIARDIALGMNYLHQHHPSVLHLDLKSMNVLLTQHLRAKIADFGFSKLRHDANLGRSGGKHNVRGTPAWMAPELLDGGDITVKVDVFSFGVILWEMLTREHPYKGCSLFQVIEKVRTKKRPEIPPQCPKSLATLICKCWAHLPSKRPTFKEIIPILEQMHFPPQWRMLFSAAGVPASALEDIESTRTLIDIITNSIDQMPPQPSEVDSGCGVSLSPNSGHHSIPDTQVDEGMRVSGYGHHAPELSLTGYRPSQSVVTDDFLTTSIEAVRTANETVVSSRQDTRPKPKTPRRTQGVPPPPPPPPPVPSVTASTFATPSQPDVFHDLVSGIKDVHLKPIPEQPEDGRRTSSPFALAVGDLAKQRANLKSVQHLPRENTNADNSSFLITSGDLAQQKQRLRQVRNPDVSQLRNLNEVGHDKLNSMAEILRKAMENRRIVIQGGEPSVDQSLNTVDWSQAEL